MNDNTDDPWAEYARLSEISDSDTVDDRVWGADEALDALLDSIESQAPMSSTTLTTMIHNRARKHRARRRLMAHNIILFPTIATDEEERQAARHQLRYAASVLTTIESRVLLAIANGETYGELAGREAVPIGTIKTWVHRARRKIKH